LTTEQLQAARVEKWRQKANAVLTLEDAATWIESTGVCPFLPRRAQFPVPAPSFAEAVLGQTNPTPAPATIHDAFSLAIRLINSGGAIPLNLLGSVSEQADFLVSPEALPYIFSLRGDRNWKRGPGGKTSQLAIDVWKLLHRAGALTLSELQENLGGGVSESAVHRALTELWSALYVIPVYAEGESTSWSLFELQHQKAAHVGGGMAQATALSALISLYLDTVIAATTDDVETFLSPLAPRSRIREIARGLLAMRQLSTLSLGTQSLLFITGCLPEFPTVETVAEAEASSELPAKFAVPVAEERPRQPRQPRKPFTPRPPRREPRESRPFRKEGGFDRKKSFAAREDRPFQKRKPFGDRDNRQERPERGERREWKPRQERTGESRPFRKEGSFDRKKSFAAREDRPFQKRKPFGDRDNRQERPERGERREWKPRQERTGESRPFRKEGSFDRKKSFAAREDRPFQKQKPFGNRDNRQERPERGERREWKPRQESTGESRPFRKEGGFDRKKSFAAREDRPFQKQKPFARKERSERSAFPRSEREKRPEGARERKPFSKPRGEFKPKSGPKKTGTRYGSKTGPKFGTPKPGKKFSPRPGNKPPYKKRDRRKDDSGE
jgi:hypothetical protein